MKATITQPDPIYHTRKSSISFTQIVIVKAGRRFISQFAMKYTSVHNKIDVSIGGTSIKECIDKTETFLSTKLKLSEITLP